MKLAIGADTQIGVFSICHAAPYVQGYRLQPALILYGVPLPLAAMCGTFSVY